MNLDNVVESIIVKSRRLVEQRNRLSDENEQLKIKISKLEAANLSQESVINDLLEKQKVKQLTGVLGKEEKKTSVRKIDEVVKEIDRCIALLNS